MVAIQYLVRSQQTAAAVVVATRHATGWLEVQEAARLVMGQPAQGIRHRHLHRKETTAVLAIILPTITQAAAAVLAR